jgi:DNA-binding NarL/FixJ family response regulator
MEILIIHRSIEVVDRLGEIVSGSENIRRIHKASSYEEATRLFLEFQPGFVILDSGLSPKVSFKILEEIKKTGRKTCVVVLSRGLDKYIMEEYISLGADFIFDEFYDFEKICGVINMINQPGKRSNNNKNDSSNN